MRSQSDEEFLRAFMPDPKAIRKTKLTEEDLITSDDEAEGLTDEKALMMMASELIEGDGVVETKED